MTDTISEAWSKAHLRATLRDTLGITISDRRYNELTLNHLRQMILLVTDKPLPYQPRRDDEVAKWLKAQRDELPRDHWGNYWSLIDNLLDDYRLHADTGTPLDRHACTHDPCDTCRG